MSDLGCRADAALSVTQHVMVPSAQLSGRDEYAHALHDAKDAAPARDPDLRRLLIGRDPAEKELSWAPIVLTHQPGRSMPTKPAPSTRRAEKFKDGQKKSGGVRTPRHAGPGRASKTAPKREKRAQP